MLRFTATIEKFADQGEKTGWSYIRISAEQAGKLMPGTRKAFRVKGKVDDHPFSMLSLMPMGDGSYIMTINGSMRKAIRKQKGATIKVALELDEQEMKPPAALMECLEDEPEALARFQSLTKGHQNYYTMWINNAKTEPTKAKRIAATINSMVRGYDFGQMIRAMKANKIS